jgi:hypothetical protein
MGLAAQVSCGLCLDAVYSVMIRSLRSSLDDNAEGNVVEGAHCVLRDLRTRIRPTLESASTVEAIGQRVPRGFGQCGEGQVPRYGVFGEAVVAAAGRSKALLRSSRSSGCVPRHASSAR